MSEEEKKTQIDKLLEVMTDYGITSYIGLNFAEIRKEIIVVRKENAELKEKLHEKNERIVELNKLLGDKE